MRNAFVGFRWGVCRLVLRLALLCAPDSLHRTALLVVLNRWKYKGRWGLYDAIDVFNHEHGVSPPSS